MILLSLAFILISMVIIWKASDPFETASNYLGRNLSNGVKGATINAIGSSLPELLATSVALLYYFDNDGFSFGIGTTAGSAIFNVAVIPSLVILAVILAGMVKKVHVSKKVILRDGIALILAEIVLIILLSQGTIDWTDGLILIAVYALYICFMFMTMDKGGSKKIEDDEVNGMTTKKAWGLLLLAVSIISGACWLLVEGCYMLGAALDIKIYFVSVLLAAAATSVPDTILSIKDAKAGNYDDAVSNALGSNIFDICVCLGLPLLIFSLFNGPITINVADGSVAELRVLLLIFTVVAFLIYFINQGMGWLQGVALFGLYGLFVAYIYLRAQEYPPAMEVGRFLQSILQGV